MSTPTALVTGGSRGIGRAIVRRLVDDGYHVLFSYRRDHEAAERLHSDTGGWATSVVADAADPNAIDRLYATADRYFARQPRPALEEAGDEQRPYLNLLVNSAGVLGGHSIIEETVQAFDHLIAVNTRGFLLTLQQAIPRLLDGGRVIAISSLSTRYCTPGEASYAASKAAVERIVSVAAKELGSRGITVNAIAAGPTDTEPLRSELSQQALEQTAAFTPLGRLGRPEDIASVVSFLAGPDGAWVTGQAIGVDGGLT